VLLKADAADETTLRYESIRAVHWKLARLACSVTASKEEVPFQPGSARRVDIRAVERFRAEVGRFAEADDRVDRGALIGYLTANARRLARGVGSEHSKRALFSAMGEATLLLAWMTFDVAPESALTQRYFTYARLLAHQAGNTQLEAAALTAMSEQARHAGFADEAVELAAAAGSLVSTVDGCGSSSDCGTGSTLERSSWPSGVGGAVRLCPVTTTAPGPTWSRSSR
jgi:hypothetical protein